MTDEVRYKVDLMHPAATVDQIFSFLMTKEQIRQLKRIYAKKDYASIHFEGSTWLLEPRLYEIMINEEPVGEEITYKFNRVEKII